MNIMFISGGWDPRGKVMGECYVLNIVTNVIIRKENMGKRRAAHVFRKLVKIYSPLEDSMIV